MKSQSTHPLPMLAGKNKWIVDTLFRWNISMWEVKGNSQTHRNEVPSSVPADSTTVNQVKHVYKSAHVDSINVIIKQVESRVLMAWFFVLIHTQTHTHTPLYTHWLGCLCHYSQTKLKYKSTHQYCEIHAVLLNISLSNMSRDLRDSINISCRHPLLCFHVIVKIKKRREKKTNGRGKNPEKPLQN